MSEKEVRIWKVAAICFILILAILVISMAKLVFSGTIHCIPAMPKKESIILADDKIIPASSGILPVILPIKENKK